MTKSGRHYESYAAELETAVAAATEAGAAIRDFYERNAAATYTKGDGSPVTDADLTADRIIRARLHERFPHDAVLTEEGVDDTARLDAARCWIVDPLDGTAQFVARTDQFDVLIALVVGGRPVVGVAYQPAADVLCAAVAGHGAWIERSGERRPLRFLPVPPGQPARPTTSTWFGGPATMPSLYRMAERARAADPAVVDVGFQPRSFVASMLAERPFDAFIGLVTAPDQTMASEWDIAACDVITNEAGGVFSDLWGRPHRYNKATARNLGGILVATDPATHARLLEAIQPELPHHG